MAATNYCDRCGKDFQYPCRLRAHLARKTPCAPILDPEDLPEEAREDPDLDQKKCRFCGRVFSSYDSMRRHIRTACKIAPTEKNGDAGMELLYEHTLRKQQNLEDQVAQLTTLVQEQSAMMRQLVAREEPGVPSNSGAQAGEAAIRGDNNQMDNSKTININIFGKEGLDHITSADVKAILDESLRTPALPAAANAAVLKMAMLAYSDPEHPENLTCYLPNKKTDDALVHKEEGWEVQPATLVLPPMAQTSVDALFDRQPFEDAETYGGLMAELKDNERRYVTGKELRPILVRNKDLLQRVLESLPVSVSRA